MLDTFVSLMYCSPFSNQLNLCSAKRANLKKLHTTKAKQPTKLFSDVEIVIVKNSENAQNFFNYYELSSPRLTL